MHNGGERGGEDRRMTSLQSENQQQNRQPPQKCPRCDSVNTKFCYYNNYSLNQPRYFCKTCKRYWTQGGNLRNVPVGGGCRNAKRSKTSASGENSKASQPPPLPPSTKLPSTTVSTNNPGGGFFSSFNQSAIVGGEFGGSSSNLGMLGFNISNFNSPNYEQMQSTPQFYQMGNRDLYQSEETIIQSFGSNNTNPNGSEAALWSISSSSNGSSSNTIGSSSLSSNQWLNLPGNGPPS